MDKESVRESIIKQLDRRGIAIDVIKSQVDDYMKLWDIKELLKEDIDQNGSRTPEGKENPAVKNFLNTNKQMLMLLKMIGITPDSIVSETNSDEL